MINDDIFLGYTGGIYRLRGLSVVLAISSPKSEPHSNMLGATWHTPIYNHLLIKYCIIISFIYTSYCEPLIHQQWGLLGLNQNTRICYLYFSHKRWELNIVESRDIEIFKKDVIGAFWQHHHMTPKPRNPFQTPYNQLERQGKEIGLMIKPWNPERILNTVNLGLLFSLAVSK